MHQIANSSTIAPMPKSPSPYGPMTPLLRRSVVTRAIVHARTLTGKRSEHTNAGSGDRERARRGVVVRGQHSTDDHRRDRDHADDAEVDETGQRMMRHGSATRTNTVDCPPVERERRITSPPSESFPVAVLPSIAVNAVELVHFSNRPT